jgi:hypothetical protein
MNHETFNERVKNALRSKANGDLEEAAKELYLLLEDLAPAVKSCVNEWHQQQAFSLLTETLQDAGKVKDCRVAWDELIQLTEHAATYWNNALSSARADFDRWVSEHPTAR